MGECKEYIEFDVTLADAVWELGRMRNLAFAPKHANAAIDAGRVTLDGEVCKHKERLVYPNSRIGVDWKWVDGKQR